jgi:UDP-N-acetylglucosamine/UDP-N-acetyl-alpha-D-glucosaminouronate 4-epimerase
MKVLVTGGAGFIGSNLVRALVSTGAEVRVLDNLSTGFLSNLADLPGSLDVVQGDVRDPDSVRQAVRGADVIHHLAALPSVPRSVREPMAVHQVNVDGTLNVLLAARDAGVRRLVYASSSSVYGNARSLPKHEDMAVSPASPYAASKLAGESYCRALCRVYDLQTVSLRLFNVFGPRQDPASEYAAVIPRFISRMQAGLAPIVLGDGHQSRDFTFIGNVVQAFLLAASAGEEAVGEAVNIACGVRTSLLELIELLNRLMGSTITPMLEAGRPGDVMHSQASITKAERLLGYRPLLPIYEGLAETVRWRANWPLEGPPPLVGASRIGHVGHLKKGGKP